MTDQVWLFSGSLRSKSGQLRNRKCSSKPGDLPTPHSLSSHAYYRLYIHSASQKKVYTVPKCPHINISIYFQDISIHVGSYRALLSNDTNKSDDIVCLSEQKPHLWNCTKSRFDRNWYLFCLLSATLRAVKRLRNYHSGDRSDDNLWKNMLCCVYILTYAIDIVCCIELLVT